MKCHVLAVLATFLVAAQAGQRIVGGSEAPEGKYPYQVLIQQHSEFRCGGSILNKRYVLTAGQCVQDSSSPSLKVVVGSTKFMDENATSYKVESIKIHEYYERPGGTHSVNDIALLRLASDVVFDDKVQPVSLPSVSIELKDDTPVTLTGWGSQSVAGDYPEKLQQAEFRVHNQKDCNQKWFFSHFISINEEMVCTSTSSGKGACNGDSGSPLVTTSPDGGGAPVQVGIVSFGKPCARGLPDVYTRVSSYAEWINKTQEW